jgi:hypothetical protein
MAIPTDNFLQLTDEALRIASNVAQAYAAWAQVERDLEAHPTSVFWAKRGEHEYLAFKYRGSDVATTAGARTPETEARYAELVAARDAAAARRDARVARFPELGRQWRALRLPQATPLPARILRTLDVAELLGTDVMLVGTNAFAAYEIHARHKFLRGADETDDFDLGWCRGSSIQLTPALAVNSRLDLLSALRRVDKSFRINRAKRYQAINNAGYEVELLAAPSTHASLPKDLGFEPMYSLPEQEWLLMGTPLQAVVMARDGMPCPMFVPDPRYMALHKAWLANKAQRSATKKDKDRLQGELLLDAVVLFMPDYPLDADFVLSLPDELRDVFNAWASMRRFDPANPAHPASRT